MMARDPSGLYYFVERDQLLKAYGADGKLIRQLGRRGAGPGEYEQLRNVFVAPDGSIHVVDALLARRSQYSRDGKYVASTPVRFQGGLGMAALLLPEDQLLVNVPPTGTRSILLQIDREGNIARELEKSDADVKKQWLHSRLLLRRSNGDVLVARPWLFQIVVYDGKTLVKKQTITRVADWLPDKEPNEEPGDGVFDKAVTPNLAAMWEDSEGLLWLHTIVPSPSWKPGPAMKDVRITPELHSNLTKRPRFEGIIEVVDLNRGKVLARSRTETAVGRSFGGGYFAKPIVDSTGIPSVAITRVHLKRK